jgi:type VI secretion system protein ImpL
MLKYLVAVVFITLAWASALVFRGIAPLLWLATGLSVLLPLGLLVYDLGQRRATRRASSALEDGLDSPGSNIRPDQQAEIAAMQAEFRKALNNLKSSRLSAGGKDALAALPWYLIIGPPGAGKTTALRSSGLPFPYAKGGRVKGVGGTRNCDWWLTNQAVILDTAGRWATQDDDREEWLAFLDLLKKTRPQKPVNGILVAVSATELQGDSEDITSLARALRERIDEVMGRLDMVVPVYLLVTKADLLAGFVETFGDLRDKERGQIWGVTLPLLAHPDERIELLTGHLDELAQVTEERSLMRMHEERRVGARFAVFAFPEQVRAIRQPLIDLATELFADSVYQDAPILRGIYFTSGTQEGRPLDRIMQGMAESFGLATRTEAMAISKPKSYFVRDLFTNLVFADKDAAIRSTRVLLRQRLRNVALTAGALVIAISLLVVPVRSYGTASTMVSQAARLVDRLAHSQTGLPPAETLESLESAAKLLTASRDSSLLFPDSSFQAPLRTAIERTIVRPILRADAGRAPSTMAPNELMDALVVHLLLTQDKQPDEPTPRTDRWPQAAALAGQKAAARWESVTGPKIASRAPQVVAHLVRWYADQTGDPGDLSERERRFVTSARTHLVGGDDDPLAELMRDPAMPRDLRAVDILGGAAIFFAADQGKPKSAVRGAFTPAGYRVVKERLAQLLKAQDDDENSWILGKDRKIRDAQAIARIRKDYFNQYVGAWKTFLFTLSVREPAHLDETRAFLKKLAGDKPFAAVWRNLIEFTNLSEPPPASALDQAKGAIGVERAPDEGARQVAAEFEGLLRFASVKPSGFDQYDQILVEVAAALGEQGTPEAKSFQTAVRSGRTNLTGLLGRYNDRGWEQGVLERILMPPLRGAEAAVLGAGAELANRKWCETVVVTFDELLAGKFPFSAAKTATEARLADVEKFFQPNTGVLWQYFAQSVQPDVEQAGSMFRMKEGASLRYQESFLAFWSRAQDITRRLFAKDPNKLGMPIEVRIRPSAQYSRIVFDAGTRKLVGLNALDRWDEILWPARRALVHLYVKTDEAGTIGPAEDSDWALYRFLNQGSPSKNRDILSLSFVSANQGKVQLDFRPEGVRDLFARFALPRSITQGAGACRR